MRFESYAQEWEDLILYIALQDVEKGFYIDIGANDPIDLSVTKYFYDNGWNGINIEPIRSKCMLLQNKRERDINLCIGIGNKKGKQFLTFAGTGSTFSEEIAEKNELHSNSKFIKTMLTLSDIYNMYCRHGQEIHFCKIDVEGYEKEVLEGVCDWNIFRPWIFVMESTYPGTTIPCYDKWENILIENGYIFVYSTKLV